MPTLPPACDRKTRSKTDSTTTPSTASTAARISSPWASSRAYTLMSRVTVSLLERMMSTPPTWAPASPIAPSTRPSIPTFAGMAARTLSE